jgi:hypothetical protein
MKKLWHTRERKNKSILEEPSSLLPEFEPSSQFILSLSESQHQGPIVSFHRSETRFGSVPDVIVITKIYQCRRHQLLREDWQRL